MHPSFRYKTSSRGGCTGPVIDVLLHTLHTVQVSCITTISFHSHSLRFTFRQLLMYVVHQWNLPAVLSYGRREQSKTEHECHGICLAGLASETSSSNRVVVE